MLCDHKLISWNSCNWYNNIHRPLQQVHGCNSNKPASAPGVPLFHLVIGSSLILFQVLQSLSSGFVMYTWMLSTLKPVSCSLPMSPSSSRFFTTSTACFLQNMNSCIAHRQHWLAERKTSLDGVTLMAGKAATACLHLNRRMGIAHVTHLTVHILNVTMLCRVQLAFTEFFQSTCKIQFQVRTLCWQSELQATGLQYARAYARLSMRLT